MWSAVTPMSPSSGLRASVLRRNQQYISSLVLSLGSSLMDSVCRPLYIILKSSLISKFKCPRKCNAMMMVEQSLLVFRIWSYSSLETLWLVKLLMDMWLKECMNVLVVPTMVFHYVKMTSKCDDSRKVYLLKCKLVTNFSHFDVTSWVLTYLLFPTPSFIEV